jgi:hypothetical protein
VQKGLRTLSDATLAIITRTRAHGRRTIDFVRGLRGSRTATDAQADDAPPPAPPPVDRRDTTTSPQAAPSSSSPPACPPELIARACALIAKATPGRVLDAATKYTAEWVARALDRVQERNATPGNKPVRS